MSKQKLINLDGGFNAYLDRIFEEAWEKRMEEDKQTNDDKKQENKDKQ